MFTPDLQSNPTEARSWKQRIAHEIREIAEIFLVITIFIAMLLTYRILLMDEFESKAYLFGIALINALVIAKAILIGEYFRLGHRGEDRPLIFSVILKAFLFSVLTMAFFVLEDLFRDWRHGEHFVITPVHRDEMIARYLLIFIGFIPLFAYRELRRVLGPQTLRDLFLKRPAAAPDRNPSFSQTRPATLS